MSAMRARKPWERHVVVTSDSDASIMLLCLPSIVNAHISDGGKMFSNFNVSSWVIDNWQRTCGEFGVCGDAPTDPTTAPRKRQHGMARGKMAFTPPPAAQGPSAAAALPPGRKRAWRLPSPLRWPGGLRALPRVLPWRRPPGPGHLCRAVAVTDVVEEPPLAPDAAPPTPPAAEKGKPPKRAGKSAQARTERRRAQAGAAGSGKKAPAGVKKAPPASPPGKRRTGPHAGKAGGKKKAPAGQTGAKEGAPAGEAHQQPSAASPPAPPAPKPPAPEKKAKPPKLVSGLLPLRVDAAQRDMLKNFQRNAYPGQKQLFNAVRRVRAVCPPCAPESSRPRSHRNHTPCRTRAGRGVRDRAAGRQ